MSISEQIKVLCVRANISNAELARRLGVSPQSLSAKMKRASRSEVQDRADTSRSSPSRG